MLGRTVSREVLRSGIPIALATDSAISAPTDLLDEMAVARRYLPADRVAEMVTTIPAKILRMPPSRDWIAVRDGAVAVVVIGGQSLCLLLTLLVTPVAYSLLEDLAGLVKWPRLAGQPASRLEHVRS